MMIQKLYKQFAEWVTKWQINLRIDEFFQARLGLTFYYLVTAIIILGGSSIITYNAILSNITQSILERGFNPSVSQAILADTQSILINRFVTIDSLIILSTVIIGFFLTNETLKPIKSNMLKQKRFIADASHELRTPIAVVISGIEVALSNKKLDFPLAKKTLEETLKEMIEFSKLSNTLLEISTSTRLPHTRHAPIRIDELIKSISEKYKNVARSKMIGIETQIEPKGATVEGNEIEFTRVFYNILDNAVKYTPQNGTIKISGEVNINNYLITVSDTGGGISEENIDRIFEPFFRGDAARTTTNGSGLGLTLVKKIVEDHKGTISIKSRINKGTSVIVSIPLSS